MIMKKFVLVVLAGALVAGQQVAVAQGAHARPSMSVAATDSPNLSKEVTWTDWDGFAITTYQKCLNRRSFISTTYAIPLNGLRCQQRQGYYYLQVSSAYQ